MLPVKVAWDERTAKVLPRDDDATPLMARVHHERSAACASAPSSSSCPSSAASSSITGGVRLEIFGDFPWDFAESPDLEDWGAFLDLVVGMLFAGASVGSRAAEGASSSCESTRRDKACCLSLDSVFTAEESEEDAAESCSRSKKEATIPCSAVYCGHSVRR